MTGNVYAVHASIATVTAAKTLIQIKAGATTPLELLRCGVSFSAFSETSDTAEITILRKSAAATVTSFTPLLYNGIDAAADAVGGTAATGHTATVEGTDGDILYREAVNVLAGFQWLPTPEERLIVPSAGIVAIKSNLAITSATAHAIAIFREIG